MAISVTSSRDKSSLSYDPASPISSITASERLADLVSAVDSLDEKTLQAAFDILDGKRVATLGTKVAQFLSVVSAISNNSEFNYAVREFTLRTSESDSYDLTPVIPEFNWSGNDLDWFGYTAYVDDGFWVISGEWGTMAEGDDSSDEAAKRSIERELSKLFVG